MKYTHRRDNLRIEIDVHQCRLSQAVIDKMHAGVDSLTKQVEHFPVADLHVLVEHNARSNDYTIKTDLFLTGQTLVAGCHDALVYTAFEHCVDALAAEVQAYKDRLGMVAEHQKQEKATHQTLEPTAAPDLAAIDAAVRDGDYAAFRTATFAYEEPVRKRIGRWVERYPEAEARIGKKLEIADIVEEVFLDAFEHYGRRPKEVRFGEWLEERIDPAVKELLAHPDRELENIDLARTARAAEKGADAV